MSRGKLLPYEPALRVPMVVRGPGIEPGTQSQEIVANQDIAPTLLNLAGARAARRMDGRSMARFWRKPERISRRPILISSYSSATPLVPGDYPGETLVPTVAAGSDSVAGTSGLAPNTDYVGIRLGPYKYVELGSGEGELYVLTRDPAELENRYSDPRYRRDRQVPRHRTGPAARLPRRRMPGADLEVAATARLAGFGGVSATCAPLSAGGRRTAPGGPKAAPRAARR